MCNVSAIVGVDAEPNVWYVNDVSQTEIVSQWRDVSADEQHKLHDKVDEILRPLGLETRLLVMRRANGIALYFTCSTLSAVRSLRDQWRSRGLRHIVNKLFTVLSTASDDDDDDDTVPVKRLTWPVTDYEECLVFFSTVQGKELSYILCTYSWLKYSVRLRYLGALG